MKAISCGCRFSYPGYNCYHKANQPYLSEKRLNVADKYRIWNYFCISHWSVGGVTVPENKPNAEADHGELEFGPSSEDNKNEINVTSSLLALCIIVLACIRNQMKTPTGNLIRQSFNFNTSTS
jgi:hypothetical protein